MAHLDPRYHAEPLRSRFRPVYDTDEMIARYEQQLEARDERERTWRKR